MYFPRVSKEGKCDLLIDCLFSFLFFQASFTIKTQTEYGIVLRKVKAEEVYLIKTILHLPTKSHHWSGNCVVYLSKTVHYITVPLYVQVYKRVGLFGVTQI